jgi:hypothetical protein
MPESRAVQRKRSGLSIDLSGLAGSPEMAKANPQFLQDEESWRASTGDYKSKFDGSKPYKSPGFFGRLAKNPGDLKNTEYMLGKEAMSMEQGFKQDMAKMDLANRLAERGYVAQAQKGQAEIDYNNALTLKALDASNQQTTDKLNSDNTKEETSLLGKVTQKTNKKRLRGEDKNDARKADRDFKAKNNIIPSRPYVEGLGEQLDANAIYAANNANRFLDAKLAQEVGAGAQAGWLSVGNNARVNVVDENRESLLFNPQTEEDRLRGIQAKPAYLQQSHLNVSPFARRVLDEPDTPDTPGAGKVKITAKPDDEYDTAIKGVFNNTPFSHSSYKGATRGEMMDMFNMAVGADNGIMPESIGDSVFYSYPFGRLPIDEQQRLYNNLNPRQKRQTALLLQNMSQGK